jgi:hypothetical protein
VNDILRFKKTDVGLLQKRRAAFQAFDRHSISSTATQTQPGFHR